MPNVKNWYLLPAVVVASLLVSCGELGQVEQGLVIEYDQPRGLMTLITDSNPSGDPNYDMLPPAVVRIPQNPSQMGPEPAAGMLLHLDTAAGRMVVYDPNAQALREVPFSTVESSTGIFPDDTRVTGANLPVVDATGNRVTFYSPRTLELLTVSVSPEFLSLPAECWKSGDEVRYYFKDPSQALRVMNVTKTGES